MRRPSRSPLDAALPLDADKRGGRPTAATKRVLPQWRREQCDKQFVYRRSQSGLKMKHSNARTNRSRSLRWLSRRNSGAATSAVPGPVLTRNGRGEHDCAHTRPLHQGTVPSKTRRP
jgi:hypothetical protein